MIGMMSRLKCIDNSGATMLRVIKVIKAGMWKAGGRTKGTVGDEVAVSIRRAKPAFEGTAAIGLAQKVRKGDVRRAVIVRARKEVKRPDGRYIKFDDNAAVLINNKREPLASKVNGIVAQEVRQKGFGRVAALASKVI